jgi:hypothetical protein
VRCRFAEIECFGQSGEYSHSCDKKLGCESAVYVASLSKNCCALSRLPSDILNLLRNCRISLPKSNACSASTKSVTTRCISSVPSRLVHPRERPSVRSHRYRRKSIEAAERIMAGMPNAPKIEYARSKACTVPSLIRLPYPAANRCHCRRTLCHCISREMSHATGIRNGLTARQSQMPRRSARPHTPEDVGSQFVRRRECLPPLLRTMLRTFKGGSRSCEVISA